MKYPIGIQNFENLRREGYVYVDKTSLIYRLVDTGKYYFLSRPRRFGKSLLLSTMEAYFEGKKELFEGLAMEKLETEWKEYPVLRIDLNGENYRERGNLERRLDAILSNMEVVYGAPDKPTTFAIRFERIIRHAYEQTGRQVVILIDEYDKPIVDNLTSPELMEQCRNQLQAFYSVMKSQDGYIRFGFLTGVTKIGKLSVFSGLNNLSDISMLPAYSTICGISEAEIHEYFDESVGELAEYNGLNKEQCYEKLREEYDGYHFCVNSVGVYNPFSLLNTLRDKLFQSYWFATGTPTFLVEVMKRTSYDITKLETENVDSSALARVDTMFEDPIPVLFQSGYLTIVGYKPVIEAYTLGFPNKEVKKGFLEELKKYYVPKGLTTNRSIIVDLYESAVSGDAEGFMRRLEALFADVDYQIQGNAEKDFQYAMYIIISLLGIYIEAERHTSSGRIDLLIKTSDYIYIIEIKIDSTADEALAQIEAKNYAQPFASDPRRLFKIGVNFSTSSRSITDWKVVE